MTASSSGPGSREGPRAAALPRLHVIAGDEELAGPDFRDRLAGMAGVGGGRLAVHLRGRRMTAARLYGVAKGAVEMGRDWGTLIVVNDRLDVALAAGAGGVHLREDSMGPRTAREVVGMAGGGRRGFLVGRSIHAPERAAALAGGGADRAGFQRLPTHPAERAAALAGGGADYLVLGSVYETASHPGLRPIGAAAVAEAAATVAVPVLAIGGVGPGQVAGLLARGAHGVVAKSGVWDEDDPSRAVARYLEVLHAED